MNERAQARNDPRMEASPLLQEGSVVRSVSGFPGGKKKKEIHHSRSVPQSDPQRLLRLPVPGRSDDCEQGQATGFEQAQKESRNS